MFPPARLLPTLMLFFVVASVHPVAQAPGAYRQYVLGSSVQAVTALARTGVAPVQTSVQRPALIQTMVWRRPYLSTDSQPALRDPVKQVEFSFYDDQLFRMVVDYESDRTRGLTAADFIDALSAVYGPVQPGFTRTPAVRGSEDADATGRLIGQWSEQDLSVLAYQDADFYTGPGGSRFKLIVTSSRLSGLSRTAILESAKQDQREAPQREIDRARKQSDDDRVAQEKARSENKAAFKP